MAIMYPPEPRPFDDWSHEDKAFEVLRENLSKEYHVFHSLTIVDGRNTRELDFLIFHPEKGIICLEAKAGANISIKNGIFYYGNNEPIDNYGGPFNQAKSAMYALMNYVKHKGYENINWNCKYQYAVWFMDMSPKVVDSWKMPPEASRERLLTNAEMQSEEALIDKIESIFALPIKTPDIKTELNEGQINVLFEDILAPSANLVDIRDARHGNAVYQFQRMQKEQLALLNYLDEQRMAVINGMAGTGKTVMARVKAQRHAEKGEDVLFLCYNRPLRDDLNNRYAHEHVKYLTLDMLAHEYGCTSGNGAAFRADYEKLADKLMEAAQNGDFPYKHIIIDEGQDFGRRNMRAGQEFDVVDEYDEESPESLVVSILRDIIECNEDGSFYIFYDKNQMIQADEMPSYIRDAECKLTLYRNCRNTLSIAKTSMRMLQMGIRAQVTQNVQPLLSRMDRRLKMKDNAIESEAPEIYICKDEGEVIATLEKVLDEYYADNLKGRLNSAEILTVRGKGKSILDKAPYKEKCMSKPKNLAYGDHQYKKRGEDGKWITAPISTCRRFKGLEADEIILIDLDRKFFLENPQASNIAYVGASRAKYKLVMITMLDNKDCQDILDHIHVTRARRVSPYEKLSQQLNVERKPL